MKLSVKGERFIQRHEVLRLDVYHDPGGVLTVGWGHVPRPGDPPWCLRLAIGQTISTDQARELFRIDADLFEGAVSDLVQTELSQSRFDCLVDFAWNVGVTALRDSTLLAKLNLGQYSAVPSEMMRWTRQGEARLPGLIIRRASCALLWWMGDYRGLRRDG